MRKEESDMRKGRFTDDEKSNKEIKVFVEDDNQGMTIVRDAKRVISVVGNTGGPTSTSDLGIDFNNPPPDTVIYTKTNPRCGYYYFNGKWYYR